MPGWWRNSLANRFVLNSLMAKLRCKSLAERSHVPAFVYFFQMLFPFSWVRQPHSGVAAAAGGCMLVNANALARAGGMASIRNSLIDDCSLAAKLKDIGSIWLGLTDRVRSIRPYRTLSDVKYMISRSAYAQLGYSSLRLAAAAIGMTLTFLVPPLLAVFATGLPRYLGLAAWFAMALVFPADREVLPPVTFMVPYASRHSFGLSVLYIQLCLSALAAKWRPVEGPRSCQ